MDCRDCKHLKRFQRMIGGKPYCICDHEETAKVSVELFGLYGPGFICLADKDGEPRIKSHPRWCPLRADKVKKDKGESGRQRMGGIGGGSRADAGKSV